MSVPDPCGQNPGTNNHPRSRPPRSPLPAPYMHKLRELGTTHFFHVPRPRRLQDPRMGSRRLQLRFRVKIHALADCWQTFRRLWKSNATQLRRLRNNLCIYGHGRLTPRSSVVLHTVIFQKNIGIMFTDTRLAMSVML